MRRAALPPLRGLAPLAAALGTWEVVGDPGSPFFPPPSRWAGAVRELWADGVLVPATADTLTTLVLALGAATAAGVGLGLVMGAWAVADRSLGPTLEFLRVMPPAAMVPIATLLVGYNERMKVTVVAIPATWALLYNTRAGVRALDPTLGDVARSLRLRPLARLGKVTIPALLPPIFVGIRVAAPVALVITLLVEVVTQLEGLGALIGSAQRTFQAARVYGLILVAGLLSLVVNGVVSGLEAHLFRHRAPR
ncbi:MAG: ABC transporter permease [Acidimicrobiia bacterium]